MKTASIQKLGFQVFLLLFCCTALPAQGQHRITIVKKSAVENGAAPKAIDDVVLLDLMNGKNTAPEINLNDTGVKYYLQRHAGGRNPCDVFIGVETSEVSGGLKVDYTIDNTPATTYGVRVGDVILALDGVRVGTQPELIRERDKHGQGDPFTLTILRDGSEMTIDARFKACSEAEKQQYQQRQTWMTPGADRRFYTFTTTVERDPCAVFIGVYTSDVSAEGRGVRVTGIVDNTAAKESGVQPGDVILSLDGQPVNSHEELLRERNKHHPGDAFRLGILRDGSEMSVNARFKACPNTANGLTPVKELVEVTPEEKPAAQRNNPANAETELRLPWLELYPNPTAGPLNIRFEAEAVPTTVRIMDASGKTVYANELGQFSGYFNEQINLNGAPGTYILTIQQGEKLTSRKIVLMPRV